MDAYRVSGAGNRKCEQTETAPGSRHFSETGSLYFIQADEVVRLSGHFLNRTLRMGTANFVLY